MSKALNLSIKQKTYCRFSFLSCVQSKLLQKKGKYGEAKRLLDSAILLCPNLFQSYYYNGVTNYKLGYYKDCLNYLDLCIQKLNEQNKEIPSYLLLMKGQTLYQLNMFKEALSHFQLSKSLTKGNEFEYELDFWMGITYYELNNFDSAYPFLENAYRIEPREVDVLICLRHIDFIRGNYFIASSWNQKIMNFVDLGIDRKLDAFREQYKIETRIGKKSSKDRYLDSIIKYNPYNFEVRTIRFCLNYLNYTSLSELYPEASFILNIVTKDSVSEAMLYAMRSVISIQLKDTISAINDLDTAISLNPDVAIYYIIKSILIKNESPKIADSILTNLIKKDTSCLNCRIARLYLRKDNFHMDSLNEDAEFLYALKKISKEEIIAIRNNDSNQILKILPKLNLDLTLPQCHLEID